MRVYWPRELMRKEYMAILNLGFFCVKAVSNSSPAIGIQAYGFRSDVGGHFPNLKAQKIKPKSMFLNILFGLIFSVQLQCKF